MTPQEENKQRIRQLLAAVDAGDLDRALAFYSPDYVDHDPSEARRGSAPAIDTLRAAFERFSAAFTNTRHRIDDLIAERDRVAARISVEATHTGELFGIPPSNRIVRTESLVIYRFEAGRIRERWCRERQTTRSLIAAAQSAPHAG